MRKLLVILGLVSMGSVASADEFVKVVRWSAGGNGCPKNTVQLVNFGNDFSLLFDQMGPALNANVRKDGYAQVRTCTVVIQLEVPKNRCIDRMDQLLSGGIVKSSNSFGNLYFFSALQGQKVMHRNITWKRNNPVNPEDADSFFSEIESTQFRRCTTARYQTYVTTMAFTGIRYTLQDFLLGNVDSIDGSFSIRLK